MNLIEEQKIKNLAYSVQTRLYRIFKDGQTKPTATIWNLAGITVPNLKIFLFFDIISFGKYFFNISGK